MPDIDLLKHTVQRGTPTGRRRPTFGRLLIGLAVALLIAGASFGYRIVRSSSAISTATQSGLSGIITQIKYLVSSGDRPILGEREDRINVLLLGMGGVGHEGAYLTDTIIVASVKPSTHEVAMLSIPRDLYVPIPGYGWRKINNANAFGREQDYPGGGEALATAVVEEVTGLDIPYYARVDFTAFRNLIDLVGGVTVTVDQSFRDSQYPTQNFGYQTVAFDSGEQSLNGERALQFVRSRKGTNGEGSDFSRAKRQQKVLSALKNEIFSLGTLLNPGKIIDISESLGTHVRTNLEPWEALHLASLLRDTTNDRIITKVIDNSSTGLLTAETTIDGAYILRPRSEDFSEIKLLANDIFTIGFLAQEQATIEIQNGTQITGLAQSVADDLRAQEFRVVAVGNADDRTATQTTIYDLTNGAKPHSLTSLKLELNATVSTTLPAVLTRLPQTDAVEPPIILPTESETPAPQGSDVDFLVVLGTDQQAGSHGSLSARLPAASVVGRP